MLIKKGHFHISGEADGDSDLLSFVESCHSKFYAQRIDGAETNYALEVEVSVKLVNFDEEEDEEE